MSTLNVYEDLSSIDLGEKVVKLQKENAKLSKLLQEKQGNIEKLCDELQRMKNEENLLKTNMSRLFNSSKLEIERKDKRIADMQLKIDQIVFKRRDAFADRPIKRERTELPDEESSKRQRVSECSKSRSKSPYGSHSKSHYTISRREHHSSNVYKDCKHENIKNDRYKKGDSRSHRSSHSTSERSHKSGSRERSGLPSHKVKETQKSSRSANTNDGKENNETVGVSKLVHSSHQELLQDSRKVQSSECHVSKRSDNERQNSSSLQNIQDTHKQILDHSVPIDEKKHNSNNNRDLNCLEDIVKQSNSVKERQKPSSSTKDIENIVTESSHIKSEPTILNQKQHTKCKEDIRVIPKHLDVNIILENTQSPHINSKENCSSSKRLTENDILNNDKKSHNSSVNIENRLEKISSRNESSKVTDIYKNTEQKEISSTSAPLSSNKSLNIPTVLVSNNIINPEVKTTPAVQQRRRRCIIQLN